MTSLGGWAGPSSPNSLRRRNEMPFAVVRLEGNGEFGWIVSRHRVFDRARDAAKLRGSGYLAICLSYAILASPMKPKRIRIKDCRVL